MKAFVIVFCLWINPLQAATRLLVTVVNQRSGVPVSGLRAGDFTVSDSGFVRRVESVDPASGPVDVMLLLDTSLLGAAVQPIAESLIGQLQPKEQMAVVSFHSAADLIQDFTSSRDLLLRAVGSVKYGNSPRVVDALYAAIDGGFQASTYRRVLILLTAGIEGPSRMSEREIVKLARRNGVSIFPVFVLARERPMFERLARQTGGACIELRSKEQASESAASRIFEAIRSGYLVSVEGNLALGERVRVEVKRPERLFVSGLPLD